MNRIIITASNAVGKVYLNVSAINKGWWTDKEDNPISKALLSDLVRFHIETTGIPSGSKVNLTIMDDDGVLNPDDKITTSSITINNNKGYAELKLDRSWQKHIKDDSGKEIELYAKCEYENLTKELPDSSKDYLNVYNVGYIDYEECRVKVLNNGDIEFWPEHFNFIARGEWNSLNIPYRINGKVYIDANGGQYIGGIPTVINKIQNPYNNYELPFDNQAYAESLRDRDLPEIENNTPKSPVNYPSTRRQKTIDRKTGGVVKPPTGARGSASATVVLDALIMAYDIALPFAIDNEKKKIKEHHNILLNNVIEDINNALQCGIINEYLTFEELCQLVSVVLYGGEETVSDKVYEIACDIYEHISKFKKI